MEPVFRGQWRNLLRMDHGSTDIGPNPNDVDEDTFLRNCLRCGRTLTNGGTKHVWRWTGFNHGLDLVIEYSNLNLTLKRNISGSWNTHCYLKEILLATAGHDGNYLYCNIISLMNFVIFLLQVNTTSTTPSLPPTRLGG